MTYAIAVLGRIDKVAQNAALSRRAGGAAARAELFELLLELLQRPHLLAHSRNLLVEKMVYGVARQAGIVLEGQEE